MVAQLPGGRRQRIRWPDYYSARYHFIKLDERLRRNVTFANHNLVADEVFCEAHLVLCRNVLIYFSNPLQNRTLGLFRDSLVRGGFLCLGLRETWISPPRPATSRRWTRACGVPARRSSHRADA